MMFSRRCIRLMYMMSMIFNGWLVHANYSGLSLDQNSILTVYQMASELQKLGKIEEAIEAFQWVIEHDDTHIKARQQLADIFVKNEQTVDQALIYYKQALRLVPYDTGLLFAYGYACTRAGLIEEALDAFQMLVCLSPRSTSALYNCGYLLKMMGHSDEAIIYYEKVLALDPENDNAHFARARAYIQKGDFKTGWRLYERFLKKLNRNADALRNYLSTNDVHGKTIFLKPEGGLGDTLQFIRYAIELKHRGAHVIAAVQKPLIPLLSRCEYIDTLLPLGAKCPAYDADTSLMTLPAVFYSDEDTIPRHIPYITPDPDLVQLWSEYLAYDSNFKIGICWQASIANDVSRLSVGRRGIPLEKLAQITTIPNVSIYSLQQCDGLDELTMLPKDVRIITFDSSFDVTHGSFMDTAAVMQSLNLVITVDTAIAHLAGAMGIPVWLLLPYETDWRWIEGRTDSPWYPTMRIFKQPKPFDWDSVVSELMAMLPLTVKQ